VRLREVTAREVMTPRVDVVALEAPVSPEAVARAVRESGHSRFPVYIETLDQLQGVLFVKDLFRMDEPSTEAIMRRLREPFVVPETRRVLELLHEMRQRRIAFAVAVDEYGGVEGVLTVKDLVSELVGDLRDEFDRPEDAAITRIDGQRWLVNGGCPIDDVVESLGIEIPEGEYVTVGGFLFDRLGRITDEGDVLDYEGYEFQVTEMDRRRIAKIVVRAPSATIDPPAETAGNGK
jgi:CBS domain containing-hemolysin-like protein